MLTIVEYFRAAANRLQQLAIIPHGANKAGSQQAGRKEAHNSASQQAELSGPALDHAPENALCRRAFLGVTACTACAALLTGGHTATVTTPIPAAKQQLILCSCFVAGFQYHQGPALLPKLAAG
ncbi:MAG: hypothetical protein GX087_12950 [Desulfobulbaceae bacterium]|nr:hypothetical protein [Desulfobulbaceae bacterium]